MTRPKRFMQGLVLAVCGLAMAGQAPAEVPVEKIPETYEAMQRQVVETLSDETIWMDAERRDTLMACLRAAEALRSKKAVPILIRRIHIGQHWWGTLDTSAPPEEMYPVQQTLAAIGRPAVQPILEAIKDLHRFVPEVLPVPDPEDPGTLELVRSQRMATLSYTLQRIYGLSLAKESPSPAIRREARRLAADRIRFEIERSSGQARENLHRALETPVFSGRDEVPRDAAAREADCEGRGLAPPGVIDVGRPETWELTVSEARGRVDRIVEALIDVARDEKHSEQDRVKAIGLLGEIGNKECLDFLVSHYGLQVNLFRMGPSEDELRNFPCMYAMKQMGKDWAVAQAVLRSFDPPKSEMEIAFLNRHFVDIMRPYVAAGIVTLELYKEPTGHRKKNLTELKKMLKTHYPQVWPDEDSG